jgi:hypothetical protein
MSIIRPLKPAKNTLPKKWYAVDTETVGLYGRPVILCLINQNKERILELREDRDGDVIQGFYKWIIGHKRELTGAVIFAHNLEFDLSKIFGNIINNPKGKALFSDSRLIMYSYIIEESAGKKRRLQFRDTFNLCPMSLSDIGEMLGYKKYTTPDKFKVVNPDSHIYLDDNDITYCFRDCEIVIEFVKKVSNIYKTFGIRMRSTYAANAKAIWQTSFLEKNLYVRDELDERFREAYYGGRCEVFVSRPEKSTLYYYDINSMYPYVMGMAMPDPGTFKKIHNYDVNYFNTILEKYEGMADITVECPKDLDIPVLPYRKNNKLLFPAGLLKGKWCFPEIRLALEKGYKILKIHEIIVGNRIKSPFTGYVEFFTGMKVTATNAEPKDDVMREFAKRMLNSLYGKFAQRNPVQERYVYVGDITEADIPDKTTCCMIPGTKVMEYMNILKERARGTVVAWAAYITSNAKVLLYQFLKGAYYCDTDSVFQPNKLPADQVHPSTFGMMALEDTAIEHYFVDPKKYVYRSEKKFKVKMKGVPKNLFKKRIKSIEDLDTPFLLFVYDRPIKTKSSLKAGIDPYSMTIQPKLLTRHVSPKRMFDACGNSAPFIHVEPDSV